MLEILVPVVGVLAVIFFIDFKLRSRAGSDEGKWPYYAKKILSAAEQALYFRLSNALPEYIIFVHVGLSRLLGVKKGINTQAWENRIGRMSADFVVCAKDSSIIAVIELDSASREREDRKVAAKKDKAFIEAGVRVIRWQIKSLPDVAAIKVAFHDARKSPAKVWRL